MKTWDDLSGAQQDFIKTHLKRSAKDLFRKRESSATNRAIIAAYGNYEDLREIYEQAAAKIPADYIERTPMVQLAERAAQYCTAGDFDRAASTISMATALMVDLQTRLTATADKLRDDVAPVPAGTFGQTDIDALDAARRPIMTHLTNDLPTQAEMTAARAAYTAYEAAFLSALASMGDLPAAQAALQQAHAQGNAVLAATAALDGALFVSTPQHGALLAAKADALSIQAALGTPPNTDAKALRALADRVTDFTRANPAAVPLANATQQLVSDATAYFTPHSGPLDTSFASDLSRFDQQPEHGQMLFLQLDIGIDLATIRNWLAGRDPANLVLVSQRVDQAVQSMQQLAALQKTVGTRMLKDRLAADGAKEAHQNGILKLRETNPAASEKVIEILERDAAILNGAEATPDFIRAETTAWGVLNDERSVLVGECNAAEAEHQRKTQDVARLKAAEAQELARIKSNTSGAPNDLSTILQIRADLANAEREEQAAYQAHVAKYAEWSAKDTEVSAKETLITAAKNQRAMLDAVTFGPLSPGAGRPIPDDMVQDVVALFETNPGLASLTCDLAATAKDPKSLAETARFLADQSATGFAYQPPADTSGTVPPPQTFDAQEAEAYARQLLQRAAYLGPEFATQAQDAIARGIQFAKNPELAGLPNTVKAVAAKRGEQAAEAMMTQTVATDGTVTVSLDLDSPAFNAVLERQKFSGDGQVQASTMMNVEMDKLKAFFGDPTEGAARKAQAETILNSVTAVPTSPAARTLLHKSLGVPLADFNDPAKQEEIKQKIRTAILKSMVTPIAQGNVGSCFATAPVLKQRQEDPLAVMEMYKDIATTGIYRPKEGRPVPAVTKIPPGDDPLTRSLEFSVAAASARLTSSRERKRINALTFIPSHPTLGQMGSVMTPAEWNALQPHLVAQVAGGYTFTYDPLVASDGSSDGSSELGVMQMVDKATNQAILSEGEYLAYVKRRATQAVADAGLPDSVRAAAMTYIDQPAFINAVKALAGNDKPWQIAAGGWGDAAGDALVGKGGAKRGTDLVVKSTTDTQEQRALKVLKGLIGLDDQNMTMVTTSGIHTFNALPPEGPTKDLLTGDVDVNIDAMLIKPGRDIASTAMPRDRAVYLYDQQMEHALKRAQTPAERAAVEAVLTDRPASDMTPAQLETHIATKLDAAKTLAAERRAQDWAAGRTPPPSPTVMGNVKTFFKGREDQAAREAATQEMIKNLGVPEFVVADTNWGDEADHRFFVIAPDPLTGQLRMWKKSTMSGELTPMPEKWLNTTWKMDD